jgi:hypothetical protein
VQQKYKGKAGLHGDKTMKLSENAVVMSKELGDNLRSFPLNKDATI